MKRFERRDNIICIIVFLNIINVLIGTKFKKTLKIVDMPLREPRSFPLFLEIR